MAKKQTYRVTREWTVIMCSTVEVEASSIREACELALDYCDEEGNDGYEDQEIAADSDGPTYIGYVTDSNGFELPIPTKYQEGGCGV